MPVKRGNADMAVPDLTEDATERKRVLNVLAQRRYRKRRRDRMQSLQTQVDRGNTDLRSPQSSKSSGQHLDSTADVFCPDIPSLIPDVTPPELLQPFQTPTDTSQAFSIPQLSETDFQLDAFTYPTPPLQLLPDADPNNNSDQDLLAYFFGPDQTQHAHTENLSDHLQTSESSAFTFPDDHTLQIPSLRLLNAAVKVALRLNVAHLLWDFEAVIPFYKPPAGTNSGLSSTPNSSPITNNIDPDLNNPPHLLPTKTQTLIPHHPLFDILPWPSTRDKLIQIFNLPVSLRPKAAQDPLGMIRLVYDMEDESGEGIRVSGEDVFEPECWEVGNVVFAKWWWAFEGCLITRWERERKRRGEGGFVLGDLG